MMKNKYDVIVTGGLGFIGKNFSHLMFDRFDRKIIIDTLTYASDLDFYYDYLKPLGWELIVGDVNNIEKMVLPKFMNEVLLVNFAAESHVDISFGNAGEFLHSNTSGTLKVIEFCHIRNFKLLHISTDEVYGEVTGAGVTEDSPLLPTNPYSATKAAADILVQTYIKCFSLDAKIIRANNIYGSRQFIEKVIPKAIFLASEKKKFFVHGNKNLSRHFLHTDDFSRALMKIIATWDTSLDRIFNIKADEEIPIKKLVESIYQFMKASSELIDFGPDRPFNDTSYQINDSRLRALNWEPTENFEVRLKKMCREFDFFTGHNSGFESD
jgi:dTDP-glucose 4,6-dehydratase